MSENKKYYWLKLKEDFFEDDTMIWLEEQTNGKDYIIFYLKLALKSLEEDGTLIRYVGSKMIPYDVDALSKLTNTPVDTVAVALKTFYEIGLIEKLESGELYLNQINELVGSETDSAKRMRKLRAKKNNKLITTSQCADDVQKSDTESRDKNLENKGISNSIDLPKKIFSLWQELFATFNSIQQQDIFELIDEYQELTLTALQLAGRNDVPGGRAIKFLRVVLKEWAQNGVKTPEEAVKYSENRKVNNSYKNKEGVSDGGSELNGVF